MKLLGVNLVFSQILLFEKSKTTVVELMIIVMKLMIIVMKLHTYVKCVHFLGVNSVLWDREKLFLHWRESIEHLREAFVVGLETLFSTNFQAISTLYAIVADVFTGDSSLKTKFFINCIFLDTLSLWMFLLKSLKKTWNLTFFEAS